MDIRDLRLRIRAVLTPGRVERDLHDELSFHIEREARKLIDQGMPPDQARAKARARFGSTAVVADECRDQRGTAFVDNTIRDVRFALRSFRRAPLAAFTIVATVAIGLGVVAVLFTILNTFLFRADGVPDISDMYAVERSGLANGDKSLFTRPAFEALRTETSAFTDAYAALPGVDLRVDGRLSIWRNRHVFRRLSFTISLVNLFISLMFALYLPTISFHFPTNSFHLFTSAS
jgi:hypothetical protein